MLELEKLRTENIELQQHLKGNPIHGKDFDHDVDRYRREIGVLENLV